MKILITGAAGMLGDSLVKEFNKENHHVFAFSHNKKVDKLTPLDITDYNAVNKTISDCRPDMIIHLAALTNVDYCELHPDEAQKVNFEATKNIAKICRKQGIKLMFISSGAVFSGKKNTPYISSDRRHPINCYGVSKMNAENEVRKVPYHTIVRTGWIIGGGPSGKKFVSKVLSQLDEGVNILNVVSDVKGSPTFTFDLSKHLIKLVNNNEHGIFHIVNNGIASRLDIVEELISIRKVHTKVNPVHLGYFHEIAPRPLMEGLQSNKKLPHWKESLRKYLPLLT
jgi:dTDP-4-dehydrorhamnose reductase